MPKEIKEIRSLKKGLQVMRREWQRELTTFQGKSRDLALALAVGVFIGFTPTIGFQTILCYLFARTFNKSFLGAFLGGSLVTGIPWLIPFVYFLCYNFGVYLLGSPVYGRITIDILRTLSAGQIVILLGKPLLVGSFSLALLGGLLTYPISYLLIKKVRQRLPVS